MTLMAEYQAMWSKATDGCPTWDKARSPEEIIAAVQEDTARQRLAHKRNVACRNLGRSFLTMLMTAKPEDVREFVTWIGGYDSFVDLQQRYMGLLEARQFVWDLEDRLGAPRGQRPEEAKQKLTGIPF